MSKQVLDKDPINKVMDFMPQYAANIKSLPNDNTSIKCLFKSSIGL